ncbi:MAG: DUF4114 domain-containing protein, partial [Xenococcaceae cyanobacterium]
NRLGEEIQGNLESEFFDIRNIPSSMKPKLEVFRDAAFNDSVGFYVANEAGDVIDPLTGQIIAAIGDSNYARSAIGQSLDLQMIGDSQSMNNREMDSTKQFIWSPFIIANGTAEQFLAQNPDNLQGQEPTAYFTHLGANPDGIDHFRLLSDNTLGIEDLFGGGDRDYDDIMVRMTMN